MTVRPDRPAAASAVILLLLFLAATGAGQAWAGQYWGGWPEGSEVIAFENLDGIVLIRASLHGASGVDSSGWFVLDTGAGYLALDAPLASRLGISRGSNGMPIGLAEQPLPRIVLGSLAIDQVSPVLTFDAGIVRRAADRPVLGLVGQRLLRDRAVFIDYQADSLVLVPSVAVAVPPGELVLSPGPIRALVSRKALVVPFRLTEDGKILVSTRMITSREGRRTPWLTFALDTGASKCVLFEETADSLARGDRWDHSIEGLVAPTVLGRASTRLARARRMEVAALAPAGATAAPSAGADAVDVAILSSPLARDLSRIAGEPVHGLLGYSFLRKFRIVCDYPNRTLLLDPVQKPGDERPFEHTHAGLQLERDHDRAVVVAVARGSPGDRAGIRPGDEVVDINGHSTHDRPVSELARLMEGPSGSSLKVTIRRGDSLATCRLRRRRLL